MSRNAENAKEEEEAKLLDEVKVMEESDLEKLRKPTRALWKYRKEDGIRFLLAGKKQIGTSPEKRFKNSRTSTEVSCTDKGQKPKEAKMPKRSVSIEGLEENASNLSKER